MLATAFTHVRYVGRSSFRKKLILLYR
jgi:hypothetical protein